MFKYIKWELLGLGKKNLKWILIVLGLYLVVAILPFSDDSNIFNLLYIPFIVVVVLFFIGSFIFGTKKVIDTFRKKTFLLESMISFSPYRLLFAKYIMAIIINIICVILGTIGLTIMLAKAGEIDIILELFGDVLGNLGFVNILKFTITMIISSLSFTSLVTLCYVIAKCLMPNGKGSLILGIIIWYFLNYLTTEIFYNLILSNVAENISDTSAFFAYNLLWIAIILIYYLITVKLIENKLEIYN